MTTTAAGNRRGWQPAELLAALATVRDPELDEPITSLGFVAACALSPDGEAEKTK